MVEIDLKNTEGGEDKKPIEDTPENRKLLTEFTIKEALALHKQKEELRKYLLEMINPFLITACGGVEEIIDNIHSNKFKTLCEQNTKFYFTYTKK